MKKGDIYLYVHKIFSKETLCVLQSNDTRYICGVGGDMYWERLGYNDIA